MACCGGSDRDVTIGQSRRAPKPKLFEYSGESPMTLFGRVTGIRYHFAGPGARTYVDARDVPAVEIARGLVPVLEEPGEP
jgi:hypothetical protein